MPIRSYEPTAPLNDILGALRRDGAVVVTGLVEAELADTVAADIALLFNDEEMAAQSVFDGVRTRRYSRILEGAPSAAALVEHDMVVAVADDILLPHAATYQVGSLTAIEILPGETVQPLHRDDSLYPLELAGTELQIGVMWALNDFTEENGGTRVVPGSHRYLRSWHIPDLGAWESAVMPKGSALFYLGSTWHGGGANQSPAPRMGLINTYSLGWLRQEVNQYLEVPPAVAAGFEPRLRALLGYTQHGAGDDLIGKFRGDCPAWVDDPPEPEWCGERGQVGNAADARSQSGVNDPD